MRSMAALKALAMLLGSEQSTLAGLSLAGFAFLPVACMKLLRFLLELELAHGILSPAVMHLVHT